MHLVKGITGEYEDRREWIVATFDTKQRAAIWAKRANDWAAAHRLSDRDGYVLNRFDLPENPYDPSMRVDYTGVSYGSMKLTAPHNPSLPTGK